jgi:hypothetical protein
MDAPIDRAVIPLLNTAVSAGVAPRSSCAGHAGAPWGFLAGNGTDHGIETFASAMLATCPAAVRFSCDSVDAMAAAPVPAERAGQLIDRYFTAPCDPLELRAPGMRWPDYAVAAGLIQQRSDAVGPMLQLALDGPPVAHTLTWDYPTPPAGLAASAPIAPGTSRLLRVSDWRR